MPQSNTPVKAIVFDIGATLVTGPPVAPNKVIAGLMSRVTASEISSVIMTNELSSAEHVCDMLESRFGGIDNKARTGITELWNSQSNAPVEINGASNTVLALKERGFKIGLLSDIWNPYYAGVEKAIPKVIKCSDSIALSFRIGSKKPSYENFRYVLSELGVRVEETVMVGDTYEHDILPALELGMRAVWVLARPERESEFIIKILNNELPTPTATVSNITEIASVKFLEVINSANGV